jgi:hypothetical protein
MTGWYTVNTLGARPESNLPVMKRPRWHAPRIETIPALLFPGYLLIELDSEQGPWFADQRHLWSKPAALSSRPPDSHSRIPAFLPSSTHWAGRLTTTAL